MYINCSHSKLLHAVTMAEKIVGKKESLPVLSCFLFSIENNALHIKATNLETAIDITIPAEIKKEGTFAVPATIFSQTLKTIQGEKISIGLEQQNIVIETNSTKTHIKTVNHTEFPTIPKEKKENSLQLPTKTIINGIQSVSYASSQSVIRPELASVYISHEDGILSFVATDSFRLAEKKNKTENKKDIPDILLPTKNALDFIHIFSLLEEDMIDCSINDSQLSITTNTVYFISRVIDSTFPNYKEIIPSEHSTEVILLKNDFQTILKKAKIFSNTSQEIGFHIYPKKKIFTTTAQSSDIGETADTIDAAITGEDLDINFNINYLTDCLQSINSDSITLHFSGLGKPLIIQGTTDRSFMYLVMPLNK